LVSFSGTRLGTRLDFSLYGRWSDRAVHQFAPLLRVSGKAQGQEEHYYQPKLGSTTATHSLTHVLSLPSVKRERDLHYDWFFFPLLIPGSGYYEKKATLDFTETECLPRLLDTFHQGISPRGSGNKMWSQDENNALVVPVFFHGMFFFLRSQSSGKHPIGNKNYEAKIFDHPSLFSGYTLFFGGHLWRFEMRGKPFCCRTGHPVIVVVRRPFLKCPLYVHTVGPRRRSLWELDSKLTWYTQHCWCRKKINCWEDGHFGAKIDSLRWDYSFLLVTRSWIFLAKRLCVMSDYRDTIVASQKIGGDTKITRRHYYYLIMLFLTWSHCCLGLSLTL
jgi:hypothetical protein